MTPAQQTAFDHSCRLAGKTVHPQFRHFLPNGLSVVLTLNSGYE